MGYILGIITALVLIQVNLYKDLVMRGLRLATFAQSMNFDGFALRAENRILHFVAECDKHIGRGAFLNIVANGADQQ